MQLLTSSSFFGACLLFNSTPFITSSKIFLLFLVKPLGFVFLPNEKQKSLIAQIEMPSSTPLDQTNAISLEAEKMLLNKKA